MTTQAERRAETRARLLAAAAERFAAEGIEKASVDAIAEDAERTSGALYAHFGSKEGLLTALLDSWKDDVAAATTAEMVAAPNVEARLRALWRNFATPPHEDGRWVLLEHELWLYAMRNPDARDALADRYRNVGRQMRAELASWHEAGVIDPPVPDGAVGSLVAALLVGLEMQHRINPKAIDERAVIAGIAALLGIDLDSNS
jgi:AcrR family transcriptional regulator